MRAGYGRGYYGTGQLTQVAAPRKTSWFKIVAVVGLGAAVVWLLWPRSAAPDLPGGGGGGKSPDPPFPPSPSPQTSREVVVLNAPLPTAAASSPAATGAFLKQVEDDARARGFVTVEDYENSVVETAKQLQAVGAKVMLAPHLQHLTQRLEA